ncbi:MAG: hypothetical protein ABIV05_06390 [Actinomycetota bacterium]
MNRTAPGGRGISAGWVVRLAGLCLVVAVPVLTWWLVGDLSTVSLAEDPDYALRPLPVNPTTERAVGIASLALAVGAVAVLTWATRRRALDRRWVKVLVLLVAAGGVVGLGWRILTAGVIGANIGAGLFVFVGGPLVAALVLFALARSVFLLVRAGRHHPLAGS